MTTALALVLSYALWYRGLRDLQPTQVAIYIYMVPVFGVLGSWLVLGEPITIFLLLGGATILSGVVLTNRSRRGTVDEQVQRQRLAPVAEPGSGGIDVISGSFTEQIGK